MELPPLPVIRGLAKRYRGQDSFTNWLVEWGYIDNRFTNTKMYDSIINEHEDLRGFVDEYV